jgi:hypothetical protein
VSISLVRSILAPNVPPLDEIYNLIDPTNTYMEGNDCHTAKKKILERGSEVDRKFDFLNRCSDG